MSNLGFQTTTKQLVPVSTADFGVITVSAGTLTSFKIGEKITGGTSGATARVSGVISATELRVKAVKPNPTTGALFANAETITGATSTTTATVAASNGYVQKRKQLRYDGSAPTMSTGNITFATSGNHVTFATANATFTTGMAPGAQFIVSGAANAGNNVVYTVLTVVSGTALTVTPTPGTAEGPVAATARALRYLQSYDTVAADDRGLVKTARDAHTEVKSAARMMLSKSQNTDTSIAPTLAYVMAPAKTYANGEILTFRITSNEALTVAGAPRVAIATLGSAETVYATYNASKSTELELIFEYTLDTATTTAGQIASVAYNANGATITDVGGAAVTPTWSGSVTGIILA